MKKTYKNPSLLVVNIKPCQLLNNSVNEVTGLKGVKRGAGDFVGGASDARGSRFSDSDWEEE